MESTLIARYEEAVSLLPQRFRIAAMAAEDWKKCCAEEFRLRVGRAPRILSAEGEYPLGGCGVVAQRDIEQMVNDLTGASRYSCSETLRAGYLTLGGGFRLGLCGSGVIREGCCSALRDFSSAALRIPRDHIGIAETVAEKLFVAGNYQSTLLLSAPGGGKTTLLRDLIRTLSRGSLERRALRVGVVDERGELAATVKGVAQLDLGLQTDILDAVPKTRGIEMLLRVMNPQIIAVDEISAEEDAAQMIRAANCGVGLLATMHAEDLSQLRKKPIFPLLQEANVFSRVVEIRCRDRRRCYAVEEFP